MDLTQCGLCRHMKVWEHINTLKYNTRVGQITKVFLKRVFLWPKFALNPNMTLQIISGDVLGSLFAKIQNGRQICIYLMTYNKLVHHYGL